MRKRRSTREPTFGFYGGLAGSAFGFLVPAMVGIDERAGLFQLLFGTAGFVVGMGAGVLIARLTEPNSGQRHP